MPFDYSTIFAGAEQGDVWLPDGTSHFQDSARTTAAGDGDPVGSLTGDQGNFNAEQATGSSQPTLRQDSEKWYLEHDLDWLAAGLAGDWNYLHDSTQDAYVCIALRTSALTSGIYTLFGTRDTGTDSRGSYLFTNVGNETAFFLAHTGAEVGYSGTSADDSVLRDTDMIIELVREGATITVYLNGTSLFSGTQTANSTGDSEHPLAIGARGDGAGSFRGRIYGMLVTDTVPTDLNRSAIQYDMDQRMTEPTGTGTPITRPSLDIPANAYRVYRVRIESPDSVLSVPMEPVTLVPVSWQGRYAYDRSNYLSATFATIDTDTLETIADELESGSTVYLFLESGYRTSDGIEEYVDLFRSIVQTIDTRSGPRSSSTLISGFLEFEGLDFNPESLILGSANTIRTGNVARGWIGPIDENVFPGDQVLLADTGETWVVGNITYRVDTRSALMDISELTDADLLAELPW